MPTFTPPTVEGPRMAYQADDHSPERLAAIRLRRFIPGPPVGQAVWRDSGGIWHTGQMSVEDEVDALVMYHGGRTHTITEAEATALETAGYTVVW